MKNQARSKCFNENWQFHLGDADGAHAPTFNSTSWRALTVPHDWSIELSYTQENAGGAGAFLPGGIGWYRKEFKMPESAKDQVTWVEFDGIYNNAEIWINGEPLGMHPYGYTPFSHDLTKYLNYGDETNVIAVRVDRSAYLDCRWYPGSGIYRDVHLVTVPKVHIPQWGTYITTEEPTRELAVVKVQTTVRNDDSQTHEIELSTDIEGQVIRSRQTLSAGETTIVEQTFEIEQPRLWDTEHPHLYSAQSTLSNGDRYETSFGIRDIRYDIDHGFYLNGERTLFKGVCLHHDGGAVGAAVPDGVWIRRLQKLKDLGCNAIRTAHNPPSAAFLDLCDRMGFLVQDEIFDEWDYPKDKRHNYNQIAATTETEGYTRYFRAWDKRDTDAMVLRDRNHPSIVMWGIGNEVEWTYPGYTDAAGYWDKDEQAKGYSYYETIPPFDDAKRKEIFESFDRGKYELADTAKRLAQYVRDLDTTRPVTSNMVLPTVSQFSGYADALDFDGYSYRQSVYQYGRERRPDKLIVGTENWAQWSEWKPVLENEWVAGIFLWPGITYLGESRAWPQKASRAGLLDLAGFEQPKAHYFKSLWTEEPIVHITSVPLAASNYLVNESGAIIEKTDDPRESQWGWPDLLEHWNHKEDEAVYVEVYSNCESVELTLNGRSIGTKNISDSDDRIFRWVVPFEAGTLRAIARNGNDTLAEQSIETAGDPSGIRLSIYETQQELSVRGIAHVTAELIDADKRPVKHVEKTVHFDVSENVTNIGVDNGCSFSLQPHKANHYTTKNGQCLLILDLGETPDGAFVRATSNGLGATKLTL